MKLKQKSYKTMILKILILCMTFCMFFINSITVSAHDAYFLAIAFDEDSKSYIGTISFQSNSIIGDNHAETNISTEFITIDRDGATIPSPGYAHLTDSDELEDDWSNFNKSDFQNDKELLFSFPGFHYKTKKLDGNGADELLAERVCNTLIPQLNSCIDFIIQETEYENVSAGEVRDIAVQLANAVKITNDTTNPTVINPTITVNGKTVTLTMGTNSSKVKKLPEGIEYGDYLTVDIDGKSQPFVYQCWKGYNYPSTSDKEDDPLARDIGSAKGYGSAVYKIGWDAIIAQAHFNLDIKEVGFSNLGEVMPTSALISAVAGLCDWAITGIRSFLGLYALDELMLNSGTRGITYTMGLFPSGWVGPIYLTYTVCLMITWTIMGFAIIRIFMRRQLATINVGEKMNIMNELKNLAVCCFLLGAFPLVFNMFARINLTLVNLFASTTSFSSLIKSFYTLSQASLGSILACFAGLALQIYFNFFYVLRAITIAILYAIAPLCIYTIVLGGKHSKVFSAWLKELMSNIFVQTIHALMIAFFTSVSAINGLKTFESIIVLYSFIPLTKFVKQNVFQAGDGISGAAGGLASGLAGAGAGIAGGFAAGANGGGSSSSGGGTSSGNGGSSGGFAGGTGIAADRMAKSNDQTRAQNGVSFKDKANLNGSNVGSTLANWANGQNSAGTGSVGGVKQTIGKAAEGMSNTFSGISDKTNGYLGKGASGNSENITSLDGKSGFTSSHTKMQEIARMNGKTRGAGIAKTVGVMKNVGSAAGHIVGATAMAGMALGTASFDEASGSRMMKNAMSFGGAGVGNAMNGIHNTVSGDKATKQYLRNNGITSVKSDGKSDYHEINMGYDMKNHKALPYNPNSGLTKEQWDMHSKMAEAADSKSEMNRTNPKEAAYYNSKAAARGERYGITTGEDGQKHIVVKVDKTNPNYQRNGINAIHSSVQPYNAETMNSKNVEPLSGGRKEPVPDGYQEHKIEGTNKTMFIPNSSSSPKSDGGGNAGPEPSPKKEPGPNNLTYEQIMQMEAEGFTPKGTHVTDQMRHSKERKHNK